MADERRAATGFESPSHGVSSMTGEGFHLPDAVAGVRIPDSRLAASAAMLSREASPPALYNHCARVYVFASLLLSKNGKRVDAELAFVASMLHDLGLLEAFSSPDQRFEIDGADRARRFLEERAVPADRAELVWDAIALHTSGTIAIRKAPEVAAVAIGASVDVSGRRLSEIGPEEIEAVLDAFPRLGFKAAFTAILDDYVKRKPHAALFSWTDSFARRRAGVSNLAEIEDVIRGARFAE